MLKSAGRFMYLIITCQKSVKRFSDRLNKWDNLCRSRTIILSFCILLIISNVNHMKNIGKNIKQIRIIKGITLKFIAKKIKKSYSAYSKIERTSKRLDIYTVIEIAEVLNVDINQIVNFDPDDLLPGKAQVNGSQSNNEPAGRLFNITEGDVKHYIELILKEKEISFDKKTNSSFKKKRSNKI